MNKLGFAIKLASAGAGNAIECNKGQWTNKVVDIREYLKLFTGLQTTDNIVTFMSFDESGCFVTQLRAISGRGGDFLSGWIYIPNTIEATGEDIMNTYNFVRNILSQSNLNENLDEIKSFFSKEFPEKEYPIPYLSSSGEEFGVRFNDLYYSMKEILGGDRYQSYYSKYKAVFLLDKEGEVKIAKDQVTRFKDLTKLPIDRICILKAPSPEEVRLLGRGVKIFLQNRQEFKLPQQTKMGDKIQLYAVRDGFEPAGLPVVTIQEEVQTLTIDPKSVKWMKRICPSEFVVYNYKHEKIENGVRISINGIDVTFQEALISEEDCSQATIKITAPDYETYEKKHNLLLGGCEVALNRKEKTYDAEIELANGEVAELTLKSKDLSSEEGESPIEGYEIYESRGGQILRMSSWFVWKQRLWGFLGAVIVAALVFSCIALDAWLDTYHFKFGLPPWEEDHVEQSGTSKHSPEPEPIVNKGQEPGVEDKVKETKVDTAYSLAAAIQYLDNSSVWIKSEMENYPDLKGLFDDMNEFNLSSLHNDWLPKLASSVQFKKVSDSAYSAFVNNRNLRQGGHKPTYNQPNDERISIANYIKWLKQEQKPKATSNDNSTGTGKSAKSGTGASASGSGKASAKSGTSNDKSNQTENGGL